MSKRAQVFISCGQRQDLGEVDIADRIAEALAQEGFQPYIATKQQTLRGLKENIFQVLAESEYFLFIDFKREVLANTSPPVHRGSVFSQQELAVAANLDLEVITLQEEGVKPLEGILAFMQANCISFSDRSGLPEVVVSLIRERGWSSDWRNDLQIDPTVGVHRNVMRHPEKLVADFYCLVIQNEHLHKTARNVYGYLESIIEARTGKPVEFGLVEFKWAGYRLPSATIRPSSFRKLDALWIPHKHPNNPQFNCFADSTEFIPSVQGPGEWLLKYSVYCDNIPGTERTFRLTLDGTAAGVTLTAT